MSTRRSRPGGWADASTLPRGSGGRALCRQCGVEVPAGRRTFCSENCVHNWKIRTDPGYLRKQVFERDRGVCAVCQVDTVAIWRILRRQPKVRRRELLAEWGLKSFSRRSLWDADHIVPVAEGGGECDLSNIRTLCLRCHRRVTAQLRARLRIRRTCADIAPSDWPELAGIKAVYGPRLTPNAKKPAEVSAKQPRSRRRNSSDQQTESR